MSTKLFVGNLSYNTTENDIRGAFAAHGRVLHVDLILDKVTGRSRGFAFVTMATPEDTEAAIAGMNGKDLGGRDLAVNEARSREDRPPRTAGERFGGGAGDRRGGRGGDRGERGGGRRDYSR